MVKSIGQMKEKTSIFRSYLNKENVYASQVSLGIVDARLIAVCLLPLFFPKGMITSKDRIGWLSLPFKYSIDFVRVSVCVDALLLSGMAS
jgi:hypothetical protein